MNHLKSTRVAVLIATAHRADLLTTRALPCIERQTREPWRIVIVDDADNEASARETRHAVHTRQPGDIRVDLLRNRRTPGAAGAWNTGLDHLLRMGTEGIRFEHEPCTEIALFRDRCDFTNSLLHLGASPPWHVDDDDGLEELQGFDWT